MDEQTILKRIFSLYSKYGIRSVGVDDVAVMLGISKKTLYEKFRSREELIQRAVDNNIRLFLEKVEDILRLEEDVLIKLCRLYAFFIKNARKINPAFVYDLKKYSHDQYKILVQLRDEKLYEMVGAVIRQGIAEGYFRDEVHDKYLYINQIDKVMVMVHDFRQEANYASLPPIVIFRLLLNDIRGICTLKGFQEMEKEYDNLLKLM